MKLTTRVAIIALMAGLVVSWACTARADDLLRPEDGKKVKVTVDGDTVKVTQAKYNQTAEIKDGKVQTVKKHTESQTEAEFK